MISDPKIFLIDVLSFFNKVKTLKNEYVFIDLKDF